MAESDLIRDPAEDDASRQAVREAARTFAFDWYLAALLAPGNARSDLITLAAFLGEVQRIPLSVADAALAEIKLQWWRDSIQGARAGLRTGSPVADALGEMQRRLSLDAALLLAVVEGRSRELYEDGIGTSDELDTYCDETYGSALRLAAHILSGSPASAGLARVFAAAGRALGRTGLALALPQHLSKGRLPLPKKFIESGDPRGMDRERAQVAARALTDRLAGEARPELQRFRGAQGSVPSSIFAAFLPLALVGPYLRALDVPAHDALIELAEISPLVRVTKLLMAHWRGRV